MGLAGPPASGDAQRPERADLAPAVQFGTGATWWPPAQEWWVESVREAWDRFRASDVFGVTVDVDVPSLIRLFTYYDGWTRTANEWQTRLLTFGSVLGETGGKEPAEKVHALIEQMGRLEQLMEKLEARFGVTPAMRARLGIKIGEAVQTAAKLNQPPRQARG